MTISQNIAHPRVLPVPKEIEAMEDMIVDISCGVRHTFMLTHSGQLWATGNVKEDKNKRLEQLKKDLAAEQDQGEDEGSDEEWSIGTKPLKGKKK